MDALSLLNHVSDAYRKLRSLSIEATVTRESGDENDNQRSEQRARFLYAAPDRIRYEPLGNPGLLTVCDGTQVHTLFRHRGPRGPHYSSARANAQALPHSLRPDVPAGGNEPFLFNRINDLVKEAETLPDENGYRVLSVTYKARPNPIISTSPVRFWVDPESYRIMRMQVAVGHRLPGHDEIEWARHTVLVRQIRVDEPIADATFEFTPPSDALEQRGGQGMIGGFGGGFSSRSVRGQRGMESHSSHEWPGETFVEHSRWRIRDATFTLERRITLSDADRSVEIVERATGPKGETKTRCALDLA